MARVLRMCTSRYSHEKQAVLQIVFTFYAIDSQAQRSRSVQCAGPSVCCLEVQRCDIVLFLFYKKGRFSL